ncbi:DUF3509 domain-containing protein [Pseudomonas sp. ZM23]|uniref:DUF3509 domain-containing protein n=1 Tax=Pseudomonas triclosanedens TaxID=2961893 RepID=A0ABY6ZTB1_9PSED|nr:DUF3509 domain-containing protein [Pseudomonas triclosanedens]MCP8466101.1 DUF3509 domain-containing protein [Pseudomonas triclosanedens]MCP8472336.1 DUF3509 domain-containing protein [Pseudomonas triclosanedens]MCP8477400.1 DUF3509 domain-containing protein [Pseudomonas triclosanedens]WAI47265.1 DUF3509 domain-containing protein [Pseudomonas triclosanedens]
MKIERLPAAQYLRRQFPEYEVGFSSRPDGNLIMTLSNPAGEQMTCRVIRPQEQYDARMLENLINRIRRDLATEYGPLQETDADHFKDAVQLQNFHESSEPLRKRRIVRAGLKLQAQAQLSA